MNEGLVEVFDKLKQIKYYSVGAKLGLAPKA